MVHRHRDEVGVGHCTSVHDLDLEADPAIEGHQVVLLSPRFEGPDDAVEAAAHDLDDAGLGQTLRAALLLAPQGLGDDLVAGPPAVEVALGHEVAHLSAGAAAQERISAGERLQLSRAPVRGRQRVPALVPLDRVSSALEIGQKGDVVFGPGRLGEMGDLAAAQPATARLGQSSYDGPQKQLVLSRNSV